ncbi:hypothetical protein ARMSODRAFT_979172 [Armillaria solidipes]|uniref:Uncharacterized protein n=1 Tax=Armillaria solidipes TaxID=1076256 RepID=A0A2H3B0B7_9AGAR|nr:hypothetical protein ARMSODRAFT_979172 [Armillaria solidipes]
MPSPRTISRLDSFDLLDFDSDYIPAVAGSAQLREQDRNEDSTTDTVSELPVVPLSKTRRGRETDAENSSNPTPGNGSERTAENISSQQKVASPQEEAASADGTSAFQPEHPV